MTRELEQGMLAVRRAMMRGVMRSALDALGASELTLLQLGTLLLLEDGEARTVGALGEQIGRSLSATSRLVEQLVKRELLRREEDPDDRRARRVTIAARGRKLLQAMVRRRAETEMRLIAALAPEDQRTVLRGLELLAEAARKQVDDV
ncbi:MAG: MarR family transcriptional regulator [Myxococcales bacterium]|nr:MarR family transcriptional regulator [Myxococcales bacterium]